MKTTFPVIMAFLALAMSAASCGAPDDQPAVSGAGSETVLTHGVVEKDGKPVSGAQVWLTLWPEDDDTPEGGIVDTREEPSMTTGKDGRFVLTVDPAELESRYFNGEYLNFDITVVDDKKLGGWGGTVHLVEERFWRQDEQERVADDALKISFDVGRHPTVTMKTLDAPDEHELMLMPFRKKPS